MPSLRLFLLGSAVLFFALVCVGHAQVSPIISPGNVQLLWINPSTTTTSFQIEGELKNIFVCVTPAFQGRVTVTGAVSGGAQMGTLPGLDSFLNTTCVSSSSIPKGATATVTVAVEQAADVALPIFVNVEQAISTDKGMNITWSSLGEDTRYTEGSLNLLQRRWYYLDGVNQVFPLISFETCDSPISSEDTGNDTTVADSQWLPHLTVLPPTETLDSAWSPAVNSQRFCAWDSSMRFSVPAIDQKGLSIPACPTSVVHISDSNATGRFFFYVSAAPVILSDTAIAGLLETMQNQSLAKPSLSYFLSLRSGELLAKSRSIAPLRINNDLIVSLTGPEGAMWPINASDIAIYGPIRSEPGFMNSTRDKSFLPYMVHSGCFLRKHAHVYNATAPVVSVDEANRRVSVQLSLFYAINNKPDTTDSLPYYGYVGAILSDPKFVYVNYDGAQLPAVAMPGQPPLSQLAQVIIASLAGLLLIFVVSTIILGVKVSRANKPLGPYESIPDQ